MGKGMLFEILGKDQAADLYDYWLSVNGEIPPRQKPNFSDWGLDIIFSLIDRESGKIEGQKFDFFYHGTARKFKTSIERNGLKTTEGLVCLTRRVTYALELFSMMGNYTMVGNKTVDKEIIKLGKKPKAAFEYWCQDAIRGKLGLLTVWAPPEEMVALGRKEKDFSKRHFALYLPREGQKAIERRRELLDRKTGKFFLDSKFLLAELKPTLELRLAFAKLEQSFAHGENILSRNKELEVATKEALIRLRQRYTYSRLIDNFLLSIIEGFTLSLVYEIVLSRMDGRIPQKRLTTLRGLKIPIDYLDKYRNEVLEKLDKTIV